MSAHDCILDPVTHEHQTLAYTCGPACINMVLSHWGQSADEMVVWEEVKANTNARRPCDAPNDVGGFPTQMCDLCSSSTLPDGSTLNRYHCWYTCPDALAKTIENRASLAMAVEYNTSGADTIRRIADSVVKGVPAVFTTNPNLHWMVAYGYQYEDTEPAGGSVDWGTQFITGVFVHNPSNPTQPQTIRMATPLGLEGLLMKIECATLKGQYPLVRQGP